MTFLFQEEDLQNATIMALAINRVAVLKLLWNYCVSISSFLKKPLLEFLYGYASRSSTSPIKEMVDEDNDYFPVDESFKHYNTVKTLCSYTGSKTSKCSIQLSKTRDIIKILCGHMIKKGHEEFIEVILKICLWSKIIVLLQNPFETCFYFLLYSIVTNWSYFQETVPPYDQSMAQRVHVGYIEKLSVG